MHECQWPGCIEAVARKWCVIHGPMREAERKAQTRDTAGTECSVTDCDRLVRARGVCNMHYKRQLRAEGRILNPPWDDRRRSNYHARRARLAGGRNGDVVILRVLVDRDGTPCARCGEDIDMTIPWPDRLSKSIDHILPLSRGGAHELANCQLMHLGCNSAKGNRAA